jgi:endonuclease/exonuclease/phosphatase (EEP) superfamily protein YafD
MTIGSRKVRMSPGPRTVDNSILRPHPRGSAADLNEDERLGQMSNSRLPHPLAAGFAIGFGAIGSGFIALDLVPQWQTTTERIALASSFIPYGLLAWVSAAAILVVSARGRGRLVALIPVLALLANSLVLYPYFNPTYAAPAGTPATLRVMALNLHYGQANTDQLLAEVTSQDVDVLVLTEFTERAQAVLTDSRWQQVLPYHLGTTGRSAPNPRFDSDTSGTQVLSRTPITELGRTSGTTATNIAVSVEANGHRLVVIGAHPVNAYRGKVNGWVSEAQILADFAAGFAGQPTVLVGDLNSVPEQVTLRNLLTTTGLHESVGGWQPTYPADRLVPLITIDHVLASEQFRTVSISRFKIAGTDHLATVAALAQS